MDGLAPDKSITS